jgi:hypothetical protein
MMPLRKATVLDNSAAVGSGTMGDASRPSPEVRRQPTNDLPDVASNFRRRPGAVFRHSPKRSLIAADLKNRRVNDKGSALHHRDRPAARRRPERNKSKIFGSTTMKIPAFIASAKSNVA